MIDIGGVKGLAFQEELVFVDGRSGKVLQAVLKENTEGPSHDGSSEEYIDNGKGLADGAFFRDAVGTKANTHAGIDGVKEGLMPWPVIDGGIKDGSYGHPRGDNGHACLIESEWIVGRRAVVVVVVVVVVVKLK